MLSCCSSLLFPDWNSFAGLSFPLTESPPPSIDAGSLFHWLYRHRYYEFFRLLITHCFGFPIQVIPRLPRIPSTESIDPGTCRVCIQFQGGRYETSLGHIREHSQPSTMITPTVIILLKLLFRDGTSHPVNATSVHLLFRAAAGDTGTPHGASHIALPFLFAWEKTGVAGFSPCGRRRVFGFFWCLKARRSLTVKFMRHRRKCFITVKKKFSKKKALLRRERPFRD